ncbi:hypothetical protein [Micromonospora sp. WMMD736]|uniref:hypothetical protein n=1 Tax=Micromonospora sp. WMMD736 TaxID=3404112 RepID=UPI003B94868E
MSERSVVPDDSAIEHQPPAERLGESRVTARDASDVPDADAAVDHASHDPYQPL